MKQKTPRKPANISFVFETELAEEFMRACRKNKQNPNEILRAYMRYYTRQKDFFEDQD